MCWNILMTSGLLIIQSKGVPSLKVRPSVIWDTLGRDKDELIYNTIANFDTKNRHLPVVPQKLSR